MDRGQRGKNNQETSDSLETTGFYSEAASRPLLWKTLTLMIDMENAEKRLVERFKLSPVPIGISGVTLLQTPVGP